MALRSIQNNFQVFQTWSRELFKVSRLQIAGNLGKRSSVRQHSFSSFWQVHSQGHQVVPKFCRTYHLVMPSKVQIRANQCPYMVQLVRGMAGHSKWHNIKNIKAAEDAKKARNITDFTRKARAIIREKGTADPKYNPLLARLLVEAKSKNIPSSNIERVLSQMSKLKDVPPTIFEAKGPGGSVMLIEAISISQHRTRQELQSYVKKCGFSVFESSSLARITFEQKGLVIVDIPDPGETTPNMEKYIELAIEVGAEEVTLEEDEEGGKFLQFLSAPDNVYSVKKELEAKQLPVRSAELTFLSVNDVPLGSQDIELLGKVLERLDEHPDVLKVYTNVVEAS